MSRPRIAWESDGPYARRRELYARAAPIFRRHGYRQATLKAVARACGLSIPALYRYFPSKKALALFPLVPLYPELHPPGPDVTADPLTTLAAWVTAASTEMPNYTLAVRMAHEAGLDHEEEHRLKSNLGSHVAFLGLMARRAAPGLSERRASELAAAMISVAVGPSAGGLSADQIALRRQLRTLLRGYGIDLPREAAR